MRILVTGATGKVGRTFVRRFLDETSDGVVRAFCHNRTLDPQDRLEVFKGSIADRNDVERALEDVTHVLHLATCKETQDDVMDVTVKGLFWLLEGCRESPIFEQFILIGGDAAIGHFVYPHPIPVTEQKPFSPYAGCYALSKVLEETMLEQYYTQYAFNGCCLRAPWIMEKDDFKYTLSFGEDVFGRPRWCDVVGEERAARYREAGTVPVLLGEDGQPLMRNFVHVEDLVSAILAAIGHPNVRQELLHVCTDEPVNYRAVADHLKDTRGIESVDIETDFHSTWLDNTKAKFLLGWRPEYDLARLVDDVWDYRRPADDPRKVWYPG